MHKTFVTGIISRDAKETEYNNNLCTNFVVVSTKKYTNDQGQQQEYSTWFDCAIWRKKGAASVIDQLKQGRLVSVEGEVATRMYQPKDTSAPMKASLTLTVAQFQVLDQFQPQQQQQQPSRANQSQGDQDGD